MATSRAGKSSKRGGQSAPKKTAPKNAAPKKGVRKKAAPKKSVAKKVAPRKAASKKAAPKKVSSRKLASKKSVGKAAGVKRVPSRKLSPKVSKKAAPRKAAGKAAAQKRTTAPKRATKAAVVVAKKAVPQKVVARKSPAIEAHKGDSSRPVALVAKPAGNPAAAPRKAPPQRPLFSDRVPVSRHLREPLKASWKPPGPPVELPRQPSPKAHAPIRKPPKPRAPKPKAISHEQAVANLQALLEAKKRREREGPSWPAPSAPQTPHRNGNESTHTEKTAQVDPESLHPHDVSNERGNS